MLLTGRVEFAYGLYESHWTPNKRISTNLADLTQQQLLACNLQLTLANAVNKNAVVLDEKEGEGFAWLKAVAFSIGTTEEEQNDIFWKGSSSGTCPARVTPKMKWDWKR